MNQKISQPACTQLCLNEANSKEAFPLIWHLKRNAAQHFPLKQKKIIPGFWAENSEEWALLLDSRFLRVAE